MVAALTNSSAPRTPSTTVTIYNVVNDALVTQQLHKK